MCTVIVTTVSVGQDRAQQQQLFHSSTAASPRWRKGNEGINITITFEKLVFKTESSTSFETEVGKNGFQNR